MDSVSKLLETDETIPLTTNPHAIASLLKKFFRELPEPLIPSSFHSKYSEAFGKMSFTNHFNINYNQKKSITRFGYKVSNFR